MSILQIIRAADRPDTPWKNGGGTTREIAVFPPGAGMDDFLWRLSMARVEQAGEFSAFPGIDRTLAVIEGVLTLAGPGLMATLDSTADPISFDGAAVIQGEPLGGPVRDINAMVRRGAFVVSMVRLGAGENAECAGTGFVLALEPQHCGEVWLETFDCARIDSTVPLQGTALFLDFVAVPAKES